MKTVALLSDVLTYQNDRVVTQYLLSHPALSQEDAGLYFKDLLAFLWFMAYRLREKAEPTYFLKPLQHLDEFWHVFILHTRDYCDFCDQYLGAYLHHEPDESSKPYVGDSSQLYGFLNDCFDQLGEAWIRRNFRDLL